MDDVWIEQVDERDSNWESDRPRFRVYFHNSGPTSTAGDTDTYDITGADVLQAIDWAQRQAGDSLTYAVALVQDETDPDGHGRGLVWLVGTDGNAGPFEGSEPRIQQRMIARRSTPVGVPEHDRMPAHVSGSAGPSVDGDWTSPTATD